MDKHLYRCHTCDIYTDGCCLDNGQYGARAGIGVFFPKHQNLNLSEPLHGRHANNRAEIIAIVRAAQTAFQHGIMRVVIYTDSQFAINCLVWIKKWRRNGWRTSDGRSVVNKEEVIDMDNALKRLHSYELKLVEGHSGIHENEMADFLAKEGAKQVPVYQKQ